MMQAAKYYDNARALRRTARNQHKCNFCPFPIEVGEEYIDYSEKHGEKLKLLRFHIKCWKGPTVPPNPKKIYKYKPKGMAKSDGATAVLRSRKRPAAIFTF